MIQKMKKVSIVLLNKEKETALKSLRKIGLVHLENLEGSSEKLTAFKEYTNNALLSESLLSEEKFSKKNYPAQQNLSDEEVVKLCSEIVSKNDRKKQLLEEINSDTTELDRFSKWGLVSIEDLEYLKSKGIQLKMFEVPLEKYNLIDESLDTILLNNDKKIVRFLLINSGEGRPEKLIPDAFEISLPRLSSNLLIEEIKKDRDEISEIEKYIRNNVKYISVISAYKKKLESDIEFENVNSGMGHESQNQSNDLAWISGYVPEDNLEEFKNACKENQWALAYNDPEDDDTEVPTKLKNNKLVSLIYPLTDFLGTVPGYKEFDISGWFLFFFTIFFGMIFGDGGYGLLIVLLLGFIILKNKISKKPVPSILYLGLLLGLATVGWGIITCTWFGMSPELLRKIGLGFLPQISVPIFSNAYSEVSPGVPKLWRLPWNEVGKGLTTSQILQIFCFALALLQLCIAHIKCCIKDRHSLKIFGDIGSLMQLCGMFYVVLMMVISTELFPMDAFYVIENIPIGLFCIGILAFGFILSFIFSNYDGSIKESIIASCKNIISVILGIVNVFSDILSYVRLWAVGLAGSAISSTVNNMAGQIFGATFGPIFIHALFFVLVIVLLLFGHGLNMILNVLSVLVHGVRLNTLEFSSHMGMEWSGIKYEPFKEK